MDTKLDANSKYATTKYFQQQVLLLTRKIKCLQVNFKGIERNVSKTE